MKKQTTQLIDKAVNLISTVRESFGKFRYRRSEPVTSRDELKYFLQSRSSYVAQMSLYGYLRTRAGMLYPQLFSDDGFARSTNIAKWHVWLACLSDLAIYSGGMLTRHPHGADQGGQLVSDLVAEILDETGIPEDSDEEYPAHAQRIRARIDACDWVQVTDDEGPFKESPTALVQWAPIVKDLKDLDEEIVRNSVRFRWQEIRRDLRTNLNAESVLREYGQSPD